MKNENMIDITKANLTDVVKAVYDLSHAVGMGMLHYMPEPLTDDEAESLINLENGIPVSMDYVKGRCCKFTVFKDDDNKLYINDRWHDHTEADLHFLLTKVGIKPNSLEEN